MSGILYICIEFLKYAWFQVFYLLIICHADHFGM